MRLDELKSAYLYHALYMSHAEHALQNNKLYGTTSHRFLKNGKPLKNLQYPGHLHRLYHTNPFKLKNEMPEAFKDIQEYENSDWYLGVSLSRSRKFAEGWGSVIFVLDQEKLIQNYKIVPMNWLASPHQYKKEYEEFVVLKKIEEGIHNYIDKDDKIKSGEIPAINNLEKYLISIYISPEHADIFTEDKIPDFIKNHKKYQK